MVDALLIWHIDLDRPEQVREVLRVSGFDAAKIDALADIAVAVIKSRTARR